MRLIEDLFDDIESPEDRFIGMDISYTEEKSWVQYAVPVISKIERNTLYITKAKDNSSTRDYKIDCRKLKDVIKFYNIKTIKIDPPKFIVQLFNLHELSNITWDKSGECVSVVIDDYDIKKQKIICHSLNITKETSYSKGKILDFDIKSRFIRTVVCNMNQLNKLFEGSKISCDELTICDFANARPKYLVYDMQHIYRNAQNRMLKDVIYDVDNFKIKTNIEILCSREVGRNLTCSRYIITKDEESIKKYARQNSKNQYLYKQFKDNYFITLVV